MQSYTSYLFLWNALNVSCGSSAHHQELNTVYTASDTWSNLFCYLLLSWQVTVKFDKVPDAVYTVLSSWWWVEEPPETCGAFHRNKLCNVASCWLYLKIRLRCMDQWTSNSVLITTKIKYSKWLHRQTHIRSRIKVPHYILCYFFSGEYNAAERLRSWVADSWFQFRSQKKFDLLTVFIPRLPHVALYYRLLAR